MNANFDKFKRAVQSALLSTGTSLTWTEIRTAAGLPQKVPNNRWVRALEKEIGLIRERQAGRGVVWRLKG